MFFFLGEDTYGSYARQLSKYFLAEGVVSGHALFLASAEPEPSSILKVTDDNDDDDLFLLLVISLIIIIIIVLIIYINFVSITW